MISLEFTKKQEFKLKTIKRPIYVRNMNSSFNKEESIEHTVEVNIYYQGHRKRIQIDVIGKQKWNVILKMPWFTYYNLEIDQRITKVKITRQQEVVKAKTEKNRYQKKKKKEKKEREQKKKEKKGKKEENNRSEGDSRIVRDLV